MKPTMMVGSRTLVAAAALFMASVASGKSEGMLNQAYPWHLMATRGADIPKVAWPPLPSPTFPEGPVSVTTRGQMMRALAGSLGAKRIEAFTDFGVRNANGVGWGGQTFCRDDSVTPIGYVFVYGTESAEPLAVMLTQALTYKEKEKRTVRDYHAFPGVRIGGEPRSFIKKWGAGDIVYDTEELGKLLERMKSQTPHANGVGWGDQTFCRDDSVTPIGYVSVYGTESAEPLAVMLTQALTYKEKEKRTVRDYHAFPGVRIGGEPRSFIKKWGAGDIVYDTEELGKLLERMKSQTPPAPVVLTTFGDAYHPALGFGKQRPELSRSTPSMF